MKTYPVEIYLPDQRDVTLSRYGAGNAKLGFGVFTYSRPAGFINNSAGTCPGATVVCEAICYAKRIMGPVKDIYLRNVGHDVPPIPEACRVLRLHVSGDFDTPEYILNWVARMRERPDVLMWAYTRSWRCHSLLEFLEVLRALPNVQLFASMDSSTAERPPVGWRRAWLWGKENRDRWAFIWNMTMFDGEKSYVCPEETGHKADCATCGYCFKGLKHDVTFLEH